MLKFYGFLSPTVGSPSVIIIWFIWWLGNISCSSRIYLFVSFKANSILVPLFGRILSILVKIEFKLSSVICVRLMTSIKLSSNANMVTFIFYIIFFCTIFFCKSVFIKINYHIFQCMDNMLHFASSVRTSVRHWTRTVYYKDKIVFYIWR